MKKLLLVLAFANAAVAQITTLSATDVVNYNTLNNNFAWLNIGRYVACVPLYYTASGSITAYTAVAISGSSVATAGTSGGGVTGVAQSSVTNGQSIGVCSEGLSSLTMDGTAAQGDLATTSTSMGGYGHDVGQTSRNSVGLQTGVLGTITSGCSGSACTATVSLEGMNRTGRLINSGTPVASNSFPLSTLVTQSADTVVMNASGSSAAPSATAMPTCTSGADLYNTATHSWSCVSVGGSFTALSGDAASTSTGGATTVINLSNVSNLSLHTSAIASNTITLDKLVVASPNTVLMNNAGTTGTPNYVGLPTCTSGADLYNTTTHAWSCVSTGGGSAPGGSTGDIQANSGSSTFTAAALNVNSDGSTTSTRSVTEPTPYVPTFNAGGATTCDLSQSTLCQVNFTGTSSTTTLALTNPHGSGPYVLESCQSSGGGGTYSFPTTAKNFAQPDPTAGTTNCTWQGFTYDGSTNYYAAWYGVPGTAWHGVKVAAVAFSNFPTCSSTYSGTFGPVNDSTTTAIGATVTGSGSNTVEMFCNGTNWLVATPLTVPPVSVTISTSGPVTDPGGSNNFLYNNASGAITFDLPAGVAGWQRCYRNATGTSGAITIAVASSNAIDLGGTNGTTSSGTLVSGGATGDAVCLVSDATNHWYAYVQKGTWTNN